ncbi:MAG TPA: 5-dehydro-4-deoxy-D-glucuronate isomerase [Spirochaetaceae bacterium]|nr:5-dehydro-4-deoxy-D-glucuronate isomerase [Spirochaetaceae bacterium]HOI23941.1 5-dehydro-4-deoxy-D-glucuronate isomerase [Spirochaetales bacterium]
MDIREDVNSEYAKTLDTEGLRRHFLIRSIFIPDRITMTYSHVDRMIAGGATPAGKALRLAATKELGTEYFFQRREMGIINIGGPGSIGVDGRKFAVGSRDGFYISMGSQDVCFESADPANPAKFYFNSAPAHRACETRLVTLDQAKRVEMGSDAESNKRVINQFIHPAVLETCQLVMGMTIFSQGSVWNTMPVHTHQRRMEVYLYFDMPQDRVVFHFLGKPEETRHLVVRNEEAVISPSWSIHSGAGTGPYTFIWGMAGENQTFTDMDHVPMSALK